MRCPFPALAASAMLLALVAPTASLHAGAQPAAISASPHVVQLEGASNFRDLGGYRTSDGRRVRQGLVFRSGTTDHLTAADFRTIQKLGIHTFCDLRESAERQPSRPSGVDVPEILTWNDQAFSKFDLGSPDAARRAMLEGYSRMPESYARPVGDILRRIAKGDVPLLFNCTAGKDRTGFTAAVLLKTLGVPHETVMADYLASNRYFDVAKLAREAGANPQPGFAVQTLDPATLAILGGVERDWLEASFAAIDARYRSMDGYLQRGLGLTELEIAAIRRRMLEPAPRR